MRTTIETISGKQYTVVWHEPNARAPEYQIWQRMTAGVKVAFSPTGHNKCIATALPPLPRYPKPEDARLLHLYAAHGMDVRGSLTYPEGGYWEDLPALYAYHKANKITHATTETGERVEIAINEGVR